MVQGLRERGAGAVLSHGTERRQTGGRGGGRRAGGGRGRQGSPRQGPLIDDRTSMHQRGWRDGGRHEGGADLREVHLPNWREKKTTEIPAFVFEMIILFVLPEAGKPVESVPW